MTGARRGADPGPELELARLNLEDKGDSGIEPLTLASGMPRCCCRFDTRDTREAFWRVVVDRQKANDVAQDLGVPVHVVYLAKSRILKKLHEEFDGLIDLDRDLGGEAMEDLG